MTMVQQNRQRESLSRRRLEFAQVSSSVNRKTFYLDLRKPILKEKVIKCVRHLGGTIEDFLSKEVDLFITDRPVSVSEQRGATLKNDSSENSTSPNCIPLPSGDLPLSTKSTNSSSLFISCPSKPLTRTQTLLLKAQQTYVRNQSQSYSEFPSNSTTIQNALSLGIQVMSAVSFLKSYQEDARRLRGDRFFNHHGNMEIASPAQGTSVNPRPDFKENQPCVKVEDCSRKYKPLLKTFDRLPEISYELNLNSRTSNSKKRQKTTPRTVSVSATPNNSRVGNRSVPRPSTVKGPKHTLKGGYCESCDHWFNGRVKEHLIGSRHQQFAKNNDNYKTLDAVISKLPGINAFVSHVENKGEQPCHKSVDIEMFDTVDTKVLSVQTESNIDIRKISKLSKNFYRSNTVTGEVVEKPQPAMETNGKQSSQPNTLQILLENCSLLESKDSQICVLSKPQECTKKPSTPPDDIDGDILNMATSVNLNIASFDEDDQFDKVNLQPPPLEPIYSCNILPSFISESMPVLKSSVNTLIQMDTQKTENKPKKRSPRKRLIFGESDNKSCENIFNTEIPQAFAFGRNESVNIPSKLPLPFSQIPVCEHKIENNHQKRKRRRSHDREVSQGVYFATKTSEMKLKLCRVSDKAPVPGYSKDLKSYWKVRKSGDCKLVFSPKYSRKSIHRDRFSRRIDSCEQENEPPPDEPTGKRIRVDI